MYAYEINSDGFIINNYLIDGDVKVPDNCIDVQLPQPLLFHKPKWAGSEWIEGSTQEEIDERTKIEPSPPTEIELLKQRLIIAENTILDMILGGL